MKKLITLISFLALLLVSCKQETYYNITTKVEPEGSGIVVVTPSTGAVLEGTSVSFLAKPNGDYVFSGWSGGLSGEVNPQTVTVSSDLSVTAKFTLRSYPLTITVEGEGTVSEKVISTRSDYTAGTVVELTANPSEHWVFDHWEGDLNGNTNPAQITVSSSKSVKAVFVKKMYDLTVEIQGHGSVEEKVINTRSGSYEEGTTVELTAVPDEFWAFDHWEGGINGKDNPVTLTITKKEFVKAVFGEKDPGIVYTETSYISPYDINARLGLGWNIGNQLESYRADKDRYVADETIWGNPKCTQETFNRVASAGFKSVRIPVTWMGRFGPAPEYKIDDEWLDRIAEVVGYAENAGMNVIINMHHDDAGPHQESDNHLFWDDFWIDPGKAAANPEYNSRVKNQLTAMWTQIARRFRDKGDFLLFESFNEPGSGFFWSYATEEEKDLHQAEYDCLNEWNQTFVNAIRSTGGNNATRWLIVVVAAAKEHNLDRLVIPEDYVSNNRLMISIHAWDPEAFSLSNGTCEEWGHTATISNDDIWRFNEFFILEEFSRIRENYMEKGIPVCIDEFGSVYRRTERSKAFERYYLEYLVRAARLNGLSAFIWDDGGKPYDGLGCRIFWHGTGEYYGYSEEVVSVIKKAYYSDDQTYNLNSIFDNAPFLEEAQRRVEFMDPKLVAFLIQQFDADKNGELSYSEVNRIKELDLSGLGLNSLEDIVQENA